MFHNMITFKKGKHLYTFVLSSMIFVSMLCTIVVLILGGLIGRKIKAFPSPFSIGCCSCCNEMCRTWWSCFMTFIGIYFLNFPGCLPFVCYTYYCSCILSLSNTHTDSCAIYDWSSILYNSTSICSYLSA